MRVWLDTDLGTDVDDALALAYILRHPGLELVGISTVFGDVSLRAQLVEALLAMSGSQPVPVLTGMGVPLTERRQGIMFGHEGTGLLAQPAPTLRVREEAGAAKRMEALAETLADTGPDMVIAIGPLTNLGALAASFATNRPLPPLAIMGGKLADVMLPGMVDHISEWNWFCDPDAVQLVLAQHTDTAQPAGEATPSPLPLVIPAEVTFRTELTSCDIDCLADGDELGRALARLCREWLRTQAEDLEVEHPMVALHDPLTAAVLVNDDLCSFDDRRVEVDRSGAATVVSGQANVRAATSVDPEATRAHVMRVLTGATSGGTGEGVAQ